MQNVEFYRQGSHCYMEFNLSQPNKVLVLTVHPNICWLVSSLHLHASIRLMNKTQYFRHQLYDSKLFALILIEDLLKTPSRPFDDC